MSKLSVGMAFLSLAYFLAFINASLRDEFLGISSETAKYVANFLFALLVLIFCFFSRHKKTIDASDNEINFSFAVVPLVVAVIDPIAAFLKSADGKWLVVKHFLGISAFGYISLALVVLVAIIAIGIKWPSKQAQDSSGS
ncbi:hypothetical protein C3408_16880 [Candidatus Pantoea alvi]|nr:hypothetical protein C3408_16880 [Pantoea alvi]